MKKIYCEDCKYYNKETLVALPNTPIDICSYPDNQIPIYEEENHEHPKRIKYYENKKSPYEINRNNDCIWYKKKQSFKKLVELPNIPGEFL